jgi:hypothetical protein
MFNIGDKIKYYGRDAVILTSSEDEILIFIDRDYIKWVEKSLIELLMPA